MTYQMKGITKIYSYILQVKRKNLTNTKYINPCDFGVQIIKKTILWDSCVFTLRWPVVTVLWGLSHMKWTKTIYKLEKRSSSWVWLRYIYPLIKRDNSYLGFCLLSFQKGQFCQFFLYNISMFCAFQS